MEKILTNPSCEAAARMPKRGSRSDLSSGCVLQSTGFQARSHVLPQSSASPIFISPFIDSLLKKKITVEILRFHVLLIEVSVLSILE